MQIQYFVREKAFKFFYIEVVLHVVRQDFCASYYMLFLQLVRLLERLFYFCLISKDNLLLKNIWHFKYKTKKPAN